MIKFALLNLAEASAESLFSAITSSLSAEQKSHYHSLRHDHRRREWAGGRWLSQQLLAELANGAKFRLIAAGGKPEVESGTSLHVNWSHSGDWLFAAATTLGPIGCDVEQTRRGRDWLKLADRNFAASETQFLASLSAEELPVAFRRLWTLKEAVVKCSGEGIAAGLKQPEFPEEVLNGQTKIWRSSNMSCYRGDQQGTPWAVAIDTDMLIENWLAPIIVTI